MAKSYITDAILVNDVNSFGVLQNAINDILTNVANIEAERWNTEALPISSNIPSTEIDAANNETISWDIGEADNGRVVFEASESLQHDLCNSTVVAIAKWKDGNFIPQASGEPLKSLDRLYIIVLPSVKAAQTSEKLRDYARSLIERDLLAQARKIAKNDYEEKANFTLLPDPEAMLIAVSQRGNPEAAYKAMFTLIQGALYKSAMKTCEALIAQGRKAEAAMVKSTYSKTRLTRDMLFACLTSQDAADTYFPAMTDNNAPHDQRGKQWDNLLRSLIAHAPKFGVNVKQKDPVTGQYLKDAEGNYITEYRPRPQNPSFFSYCLATRYDSVTVEGAEQASIDFSTISFD